jgi:cardiolipin synthase (CMP-forming)
VLLRQLPNVLTCIRIAAAPVLTWLVLEGRFRESLALILIAGLTDWFDGYVARRLKVTGQTGVVLDPLADKLLLVTLFIVLAAVRLIPWWLFSLVMGRDLTIVIGALLLRIFRNVRKFTPSLLGKISTFFQIVFVLLVLLHASEPSSFFFYLKQIAFGLTSLFTLLSGIGYVRLGIRLARREQRSAAGGF